MKFVGKTSVAVIKSAILGAFANELFFFFLVKEERARRREGEKKRKGTCATLGPLDPPNRALDNLGSID